MVSLASKGSNSDTSLSDFFFRIDNKHGHASLDSANATREGSSVEILLNTF